MLVRDAVLADVDGLASCIVASWLELASTSSRSDHRLKESAGRGDDEAHDLGRHRVARSVAGRMSHGSTSTAPASCGPFRGTDPPNGPLR
jgi:hypothetical protein